MNRRFTPFEISLINELAVIATLLIDRLNDPRDPEGPEYSALSSLAIREVVDTAVRVAAARKRLARFRRLRRPGRRDTLALDASELSRLQLDRLDLDSPFGAEDLKP
jgi:hypothetical protein